MCVPTWVCDCKCRYHQVPEELDSLDLGLPKVGTRNRIQVLWKNRKCSFIVEPPFPPHTLVLRNENLFPRENQIAGYGKL